MSWEWIHSELRSILVERVTLSQLTLLTASLKGFHWQCWANATYRAAMLSMGGIGDLVLRATDSPTTRYLGSSA
ncbi:hypothetical protein GCM10027514_09310 [Azotobacter armeniacus]